MSAPSPPSPPPPSSALPRTESLAPHAPAEDGDLPPLPLTPLGRYRHAKGGLYEVMGCVRHSETREPMVLYRALYGEGGLWVRPHAMFFSTIERNGQVLARFARLEP